MREKRYLFFILCLSILLSTPVHAEEKYVTAKIPVECVGENCDEQFTYVLLADGGENQNDIENSRFSLSDGGKDYFEIKFFCPNTYKYKVKQEKGSDKDTTYDETVYDVDVYVTEDEKGKMFSEVVVYAGENGEKNSECKFVNKKVVEASETTPVSANNSGVAGVVKTGDETQVELMVLCLVMSAFVLSVIMLYSRLKRKDE